MSLEASSVDVVEPAIRTKIDHDSFAALASAVYDDCLENIIHDIVLGVHREEKIARMRSAAILVEEKAANLSPATATPSGDDALASPGSKIVSTEGAVSMDGKIFLQGNPLETTKQILCTKCHLPRLLHPTAGNGAVPPEPGVKYCSRELPIDKHFHDIWGRPFPKEKKGKAQLERNSNGASLDTPPPSPRHAGEVKPTAPPIPSVKCPNCSKYLPVIRIGKHITNCMGYGGRHASRTAMAKMASQNGSSSTPSTSRLGTPAPGARDSPDKRYREEDDDDNDDDDDDETPKKRKKKIIRKPIDKGQNLKTKKPNGLHSAGKSLPGQRPGASDKGDLTGTKRDRTDDGDGVAESPIKKKLKRPIEGMSGSPLAKAKDAKGTNGADRIREIELDENGPTSTSPTPGSKSSNMKDGAGTHKKRKLEMQSNIQKPSGSRREDRDEDTFKKRKKQETSETVTPVIRA